jgi:hypothetical protein
MALYKYFYHEERGQFHGYVEDLNGKIIWDVQYPDYYEDDETGELIESSTIFHDGFLAGVDDVEGLENYLKSLHILKAGDELIAYNDEYADGGALDGLMGDMNAPVQSVGGTLFSTADLTSHLDFNANPMFKRGGTLNYVTKNGINFDIEHNGKNAIVIAKIEDDNNYMLDKSDLREMSESARMKGVDKVILHTNYGLELRSNENPKVVGFDAIKKQSFEHGGGISQRWRRNKIFAVPINYEIDVEGERIPYFYLHGQAQDINGYDICNGNINAIINCLEQGAFLCELHFIDGRIEDAICFSKYDRGDRQMNGWILLLSDYNGIKQAIEYFEFADTPTMYEDEKEYIKSIGVFDVIKSSLKYADGGIMARGGSTPEYETYHETLASVLDEAEEYITKKGYKFTEDRYYPDVTSGGIPYGVTQRITRDVEEIGGKKRQNTLLLSIHRLDSGRYELVMYLPRTKYADGGPTESNFMKTLKDKITDVFPESYVQVSIKRFVGEPTVYILFLLGKDKTEWSNGIYDNDDAIQTILIDNVDENGNPKGILDVHSSRAGRITIASTNRYLAFENVKVGWRDFKGDEKQVVNRIVKYFEKLKKTIQDNFDKLTPYTKNLVKEKNYA